MGSLLYTFMSVAQVASLHCEVRREISPCTCEMNANVANTINVECEGVGSFNQVYDALQNKFVNASIWLKITQSQLDDLETRTFSDMNIRIQNLRLNFDNLKTIPGASFRNFSSMKYLSLSDNVLEEVPRHIWQHAPNIGSLDLARGRIKRINTDDFRHLHKLNTLVLSNNHLQYLEKNSLPNEIVMLHLGKNELTLLNGTLSQLTGLELLFLNANNLTNLDNELPAAPKLRLLMLQGNRVQKLPKEMKSLPSLDVVYLSDNELTSFDGVFSHARKLQMLQCNKNKLQYLAEDEFAEATLLEALDLFGNEIKSLNKSMLPLHSLKQLNLSNNLLGTFSLDEIRELRKLLYVDLKNNRIRKITGRMENNVESDCNIEELQLQHNLLESLDGSLMGLTNLRVLNLGHNQLSSISPGDFNGMQNLDTLILSNNNLHSLEEASTTILPRLKKLYLAHNKFVHLQYDFLGFPNLCEADLSNNMIASISPELVAQIRCSNHGVALKLTIELQENPIFCKDKINEVIRIMDEHNARIKGSSHCFVPKEDISDPLVLMALQSKYEPTQIKDEPTESKVAHSTENSVPQKFIAPIQVIPNQIPIELVKSKPTTTTTTTPTPPTSTIASVTEDQNVFEISTTPATVVYTTTTPITVSPLLQMLLPTTETPNSTDDEDNNLPQDPEGLQPTALLAPDFASVVERTDLLVLEQEEPPENVQLMDQSSID